MAKFRLQVALQYRERIEKLKQKALAIEVQKAQQLNDKIRGIDNTLQQHNQRLDQSKHSGVTLNQLHLNHWFLKRVTQQKKVLKQQLHEQNQVMDVKRKNLVQAQQGRRALEILKEKQNLKEKELERKQERYEMDEIAQFIKHKQSLMPSSEAEYSPPLPLNSKTNI